jgi:hypothetical protein
MAQQDDTPHSGQGGLSGTVGNNDGDQGGNLTPGSGGATRSGIRSGVPTASSKTDKDGKADLPLSDDPKDQNLPA